MEIDRNRAAECLIKLARKYPEKQRMYISSEMATEGDAADALLFNQVQNFINELPKSVMQSVALLDHDQQR